MSIYYHSFRIGELYDIIGSRDAAMLKKLEAELLVRDLELLICTKAIVADGLLYHELFSDDLYVSVHIKGRRYRIISAADRRNP